MMNYKYCNDAMKNYLVIDCGQNVHSPADETGAGISRTGYQYQMISSNRIPGLLPCRIRSINDEMYLYYEITSLRSLKEMYADHRQSGLGQKKLLYCLSDTGESIARYLLDSRRLLLNPEFIFYDAGRDEYLFLYYPDEENSYQELFAFLTAGADPEDKAASAAIYQLQEAAMNPNFILTGFVLDRIYSAGDTDAWVRESQMRGSQTGDWQGTAGPGRTKTDCDMEYCGGQADYRERSARWQARWKDQIQENADGPAGQELQGEGQGMSAGGGSQQDPDIPRRKMTQVLIASLVFLGVAAGAEFLHVKAGLTLRYDLAARAAVAGGLCASVLLAFYGILLSVRGGFRHTGKADTGGANGPVMEQTLDFRKKELAAGIRRGRTDAENPYYGEEVSGNANARGSVPHKLYGEEEARSCRIDLRNLPCIVGRQAELSNVQLQDPSISAAHVRFSEGKADAVIMTDLGSAQGTYLNGLRLNPDEPREVVPGDEVRIGRLVFCYR